VNARGVVVLLAGGVDNLDELADRYLRWASPEEPLPQDPHEQAPFQIGQLYEQLGIGFLERLRGPFAIVLWESRRQRLLLARSPSGQRTLYYAQSGSRFTFSTNLGMAARLENVTTQLDRGALYSYLVMGGVPAPETIHQNVCAVASGTWLVFSETGLQSGRFWTVPPLPRWHIGIREAEKLLDEKLSDAISLALKPIRRVGCLLSGSLNSSALVFFARKFQRKGQSLSTYTLARRYCSWREFRIAAQVADLCRTQHVPIGMYADPVTTVLDLVACLDAPSSEPSHLRSFLMMRSPQITADGLLAGFGGDEILAGRPYHAMLNVPPPLNLFRSFLGGFPLESSLGERLIPESAEEAYLLLTQRFSAQEAQALLGGEFSAQSFCSSPADPRTDLLRTFLDRDVLHRLPDLMLPALDGFARSAGRILRLPFLDQEVVELACLLPGKYILNGLITKFLLRRVLQSQMPPRVLHQMARSRDVLFRRWIDVDLRELILDTLSAARALSTTIFSRREVAKLLSRHESGESKAWPLLWSLLVLELWYLNQRTQTVRVTSYPGEQHRTDGIR